ncbi:MAG: tyrosine-type recombinase/integrase [Bradyrhizobium sp.]
MPKSHSHYKDFLDLRGDGRVVLYKRADHQNPKWTVRLKIPETDGFVVKSTKTTNDFEARRFAEDLYYRLEGKARRGEPLNSPTFRRVFTEWAKVPLADQVVRSARYVNGNVRRVELWALQYFADTSIDKVTEAKLADYVDWRLSQPQRPAIVTLKNERTAIRQLLRFAKRRGYITDVPEFAIKSGRINARPDISEAEWQRLVRFLPGYVDLAQDKRRRRERFYLVLYILIMGNTGIRIGEARKLKWRDVSTTRTLTDEVRSILSVRGKTGEREVVCNKGVESCLDELRSFRAEELGHAPPDQEHVFCHASGVPVGSFKGGFQRALKEAGVLFASDGKKRVPYSLRHTYATMRLAEGVSVFQLATNMGTSVEMLEDFYGKKRMRDPKMATELTKFRKREDAG